MEKHKIEKRCMPAFHAIIALAIHTDGKADRIDLHLLADAAIHIHQWNDWDAMRSQATKFTHAASRIAHDWAAAQGDQKWRAMRASAHLQDLGNALRARYEMLHAREVI